MVTLKKWVAYFSGDYEGRFCNPPGDWEDLIGPVTLRCSPGKDDTLKVTLKSLEIPACMGTLRLKDKTLAVLLDRKRIRLACVFHENPDGLGGAFIGKMQEGGSHRATEVSLAMKRPARRPD